MNYQEKCSRDAAERIIKLIDSKTLLGAAYDCMSLPAQAKFINDVARIIQQEAYKQLTTTV